jgi:hypothetical protein
MHPLHDELDHPVLAELRVKMSRYPLLGLFVLALAMASCAGGTQLRPDRIEAVPATADTYTVYLYHSKGSEDLEGPDLIEGAVVVLDVEGDSYAFSLRAPDFSYIKFEGITGETAVSTAEVFLSRFKGRHVYGAVMVDGETVGYEMRLAHPSWIYLKKSVGAQYYLGEDNRIEVVFRTKRYSPDDK